VKKAFFEEIQYVPVIEFRERYGELIPYVLAGARAVGAEDGAVGTQYGKLVEILDNNSLIPAYLRDIEFAAVWEDEKKTMVRVVGTTLQVFCISHLLVGEKRLTNTLDKQEDILKTVEDYLLFN